MGTRWWRVILERHLRQVGERDHRPIVIKPPEIHATIPVHGRRAETPLTHQNIEQPSNRYDNGDNTVDRNGDPRTRRFIAPGVPGTYVVPTKRQ